MPARSQLTLRIDPRLARHLKRAAADRGVSVNAFAERALEAAVDPDAAGSEIERMRERFARAGILSEPRPLPVGFEPPTEEELARAQEEFSRGGPSAEELIRQDRDERGS
jgi:hypothetical protein